MENIEKETLDALMKIATCPVCFEKLTPNVVVCINGHAVCWICRTDMIDCPMCRKPFLESKPICLSQMLEALPYHCRHNGCNMIDMKSSQVAEHERWCLFRPINCRICSWSGQVDTLLHHVTSEHVLSPSNVARQLASFNQNQPHESQLACIYYEMLFWRSVIINPLEKRLTFKFVCIPSQHMEERFFVKVEFKKGEEEYFAKTEIHFFNGFGEPAENNLHFHTDMLVKFITQPNRTLNYNIYVTKSD